MTQQLALNLVEIFNKLIEIPLRSKDFQDRNEALMRITDLGKEAMGSQACTLTVLDLDNRSLLQAAGQDVGLSSTRTGEHIDFDLLARGEVIEKYNLHIDGQGLANPDVARKYNLYSLLSCPLRSERRLVGYINHFSSSLDRFTDEEKRLLEIFASQAMVTIEKFDYNHIRDRSLVILRDLTQSLLSVSSEDFLDIISEKACELLSAPICVVWQLDEKSKHLKIIATYGGVDEEYQQIELFLSNPQQLSTRGVVYLSDVTKSSGRYEYSEEAKKRGWVSLLSAPMLIKGRLTGILDIYTHKVRHFRSWEKEFFGAFANYAALSIQKAELLREGAKLEKLPGIMLKMSEANDVTGLFKLLLEGALELINANKGAICRLDYRTGELAIVAHEGELPDQRRLGLDRGITGKALRDEQPIRVDDVTSQGWQKEYIKFWHETRSELAIPMLIPNAPVRVGREVKYASKRIGVLNIESPDIEAFSESDEKCLWSLARQAAARIERLEFDEKLTRLRQIEKEIVGERDYDLIMQKILKGITNTLGFEYVNISLVVPELKCIKTEYITGLSKHEIDKFKSMAVHSLDSNDIQADIVRSGEIEVPDVKDERFDRQIFERFKHDRLIRVFIPMKRSTDNTVIGTVEAGYERSSRNYIYERDVQVLEWFVDYAVHALEQKRSDLLDRITHEFRAPIVGIRSNASFLQRRLNELPEELIGSKFNDILTDCEILLYQVGELEYTLLGRTSRPSKVERTVVYRDIIIKTINQLKPLVYERGFSHSRIVYNPAESGRIIVSVDKAKLNQVVFNLLTNSLKYAGDDPNEFSIRIDVDETAHSFIIKFKDWGIGIEEGLKEKVFEDGFRTPEAIKRDVTGSGLGLTISRKIMRQMGGDLKLTSNRKPTEFQLILLKQPKGALHDTLR